MKKIITDLTEHVADGKFDFISISECGHFSYDSHTFHYELMKSLLKRGLINCVTSERLGPITALILEKYTQNKLKVKGLRYLFSQLQWAGVGTYRWIEYFKKSNITVKIVGIDKENSISKHHLNLLEQIVTKKLHKYLTENWNNIQNYKLCPQFDCKTREDCITLATLRIRYKSNNGINMRYKNMLTIFKGLIKSGHKVFYNGYHTAMRNQKDEIGFQLKKYAPTLIIGMSAFKHHHMTIKLPKLVVNQYFKAFVEENDNKMHEIFRKSPNKDFDDSKINIFDYYDKTSFEKTLKPEFTLIKTNKNDKRHVTNLWGSPVPINPSIKKFPSDLRKEVHKPLSSYDFIVHIPISTVGQFWL